MRKFSYKICAFIIALIGLSYLLQMIIDIGLKKSKIKYYHEWNDIFHSEINADIIVQGNSRAMGSISTYMLDSVFNINSYNLGMEGHQFHMQYYRYLIYRNFNKKPKYIIQNIDHFTFEKRPDLYAYEQFLPYLNNRLIQKAVLSYKGIDWKDIYIPLYKYHSKYDIAIFGLRNFFFRFRKK